MPDLTSTTIRHQGHLVGYRPSLFIEGVWFVVALPHTTLGQVERDASGYVARWYASDEAAAAGLQDRRIGHSATLMGALTFFGSR